MPELEALRAAPALDHSSLKAGSLSQNFDVTTVRILDTYSPFPTIRTSRHSSDPFGLNAFLLPPDDTTWNYIDPTPLPSETLAEEEQPQPPTPTEGERRLLHPPLTRRASGGALRRPSPLASNPPLSADEKDEDAEADAEATEAPTDLNPPSAGGAPASSSSSRRVSTITGKGLRAIISRKSGVAGTLTPPELSSGPSSATSSTPESPALDDEGARSRTSMYSMSGSSSEGSCEGLQTPSDTTPPLDVSTRLAAALQAEERKPKTSWRGWFDARRPSFLGLRSDGTTTVIDSPRASVVDVAAELPPETAPATSTAVSAPNSAVARSAYLLRRLSLAKLGAIRMPSAHPLALLLTRQHVNLPDEVAFSIPASKRVFPTSVNVAPKQATELAPAQGGLRLALGVRGVIRKIDNGERPNDLFRPHRNSRQNATPVRPRGVRDFVNRAPFEERNVVFFPDNVCEVVSMARHGFGVWDLDFSDYIVALSEAEDSPPSITGPSRKSLPPQPQPPRPALPQRHSVAFKDTTPAPKDDVFATPAPPKPALRHTQTAPAVPKSSLRIARPKVTTWDESSDEEDDDERKVAAAAAPAPVPQRPAMKHTHTAPARARQSRMIDPAQALDMVTKARERRNENNSGVAERRAVTEQRRKSQMPLQMTSTRAPPPKSRVSMTASASTSAIALDTLKPEHRVTKRSSSMSMDLISRQMERSPSHRASSATLAAKAHAHAAASARLQGHHTPTSRGSPTKQQQRPPSSLPSTSAPTQASSSRRRVVSQNELAARPSMAPALHQRASVMSLNMYSPAAMPAMPLVTTATGMSVMSAYPQMVQPGRQSMMFPAVPVMSVAPYRPQFATHHAPQMYNQPRVPNTGRRRERPVS